MILPRLYAIVDAGVLVSRGISLEGFAGELRAAGVSLVQLRAKDGSPQEVLHASALLRDVFARSEGIPPHQAMPHTRRPVGGRACLIMNDRADLAVLAGFDGVHVGQGDLSPEDAKAVVLLHPDRSLVGVSTHTEAQVRLADLSCADYVAIGPIFATGTKPDAEAVVGLEGLKRARALTSKPLVAIGGITRANARSVIDAGADSVAVISGLLSAGESAESVARDFLEILG